MGCMLRQCTTWGKRISPLVGHQRFFHSNQKTPNSLSLSPNKDQTTPTTTTQPAAATVRRSSRWAYVKQFEAVSNEMLLPNVWVVIRVDGKNFSQFTRVHQYQKPIDHGAIHLMNTCALNVMRAFPEVLMCYGQSDELNFLLARDTNLFNRRTSKLNSLFASLVASNFVMHWNGTMNTQLGATTNLIDNENGNNSDKDRQLQYAPAFDSRCIAFPTISSMKDYFRWRQEDAFVNHVYNTCFWSLVQKQGKSPSEAQSLLSGTSFSDRNELLFNTFGLNIAKDPAMYRRGTILIRNTSSLSKRTGPCEQEQQNTTTSAELNTVDAQHGIVQVHDDLIGEEFWRSDHTAHITQMDERCCK